MHKKPLFWIIILAIFLRVGLLNKVPPSLNWDEISMGYTAYSVLETGADEWGEKLPIFFRSYGEWKSAVYIYLLVPFIKIFGLNVWAVRLPSALSGILAVYLTYLIGKKLYGEKAGLWASFFLTISPWHMMLSRPAFEANVSLTLILLGIYNFILITKKSSWKHYLLSALFFGLAPHTYNSAKIITPFLVLWLVYQYRDRLSRKFIIMFFAILAVFATPLAFNLVSGKSQYRYTQVGVTTDLLKTTEFYSYRQTFPLPASVNKFVFNRATYFVYATTNNWLSYFSPHFLLLEGGDHNQHSMPYRGVLYVVELLAVLYSLRFLSKQSSTLKYLPFLIIALGFIPPSMTRDSHHVLRSILALPGWQLLAGLGMAKLMKTKRSKLILSILAIEVISFMIMYFAWYPRAFARDWQYGHQQVIEYINEEGADYRQIVFTKWFGEPQLFVAFFSKWDPADYQELNKNLLRYEAEGKLWLDQLEDYQLGHYVFKYLNWDDETRDPSTLYIGKYDDFNIPEDQYLETIKYPDGSVAFHITKGDK